MNGLYNHNVEMDTVEKITQDIQTAFDATVPDIRHMPPPHPHKSTTHEERFYHITNPTTGSRFTVFFRLGDDGYWRCAVAHCDPRDMFSRKRGRTVSRRKFFQGKFGNHFGTGMPYTPNYEVAQDIAWEWWCEHMEKKIGREAFDAYLRQVHGVYN